MNINRHNYETYFLLYVDNELSAVERKTVEQFVLENSDLKPELQLLLVTALPAESFQFNAKDSLYKNEINQQDFQENLLLHLDNELGSVAAGKTEVLIAADSSIKNEWELLKQTKLDANEKIVFANKQILYRHERGRLVAIRFWRVAVAAAILFACLITGISLLKKDRPAENTTAKKLISPSVEKNPVNNTGLKNNSFDSLQSIVPENIVSVKTNSEDIINPSTEHKKKKVPGIKMPALNDQLVEKQKNNLQKSSLENINKQKSNEIIASAVLDKRNETVIKNNMPVEIANVTIKKDIKTPAIPVIDYNQYPAMPDSYSKTAVLNEEPSENKDKILYLSEDRVARSKIGGLFRKVKRVIERNTNIKTGNGVKIAGFEIAVR
jgi:hypothetical protein